MTRRLLLLLVHGAAAALRPMLAARAPRPALCATDSPPAATADDDDPIYKDELWLDGEMVRYGDGMHGAGVGYCASYRSAAASQNHSRALVLLSTGASDEEALLALAGKIATACECVALVPLLRGGTSRWAHERLASEAWSAITYLNAARGAEALAIVAVGPTTPAVLTLLAQGAVGAHAAIALCPSGDAGESIHAARELDVPLLCVAAADAPAGARHAAALREALSLNTRLGRDYYVAEVGGCSDSFVLDPRDEADARAAERAIALVQGWLDAHLPFGSIGVEET